MCVRVHMLSLSCRSLSQVSINEAAGPSKQGKPDGLSPRGASEGLLYASPRLPRARWRTIPLLDYPRIAKLKGHRGVVGQSRVGCGAVSAWCACVRCFRVSPLDVSFSQPAARESSLHMVRSVISSLEDTPQRSSAGNHNERYAPSHSSDTAAGTAAFPLCSNAALATSTKGPSSLTSSPSKLHAVR